MSSAYSASSSPHSLSADLISYWQLISSVSQLLTFTSSMEGPSPTKLDLHLLTITTLLTFPCVNNAFILKLATGSGEFLILLINPPAITAQVSCKLCSTTFLSLVLMGSVLGELILSCQYYLIVLSSMTLASPTQFSQDQFFTWVGYWGT